VAGICPQMRQCGVKGAGSVGPLRETQTRPALRPTLSSSRWPLCASIPSVPLAGSLNTLADLRNSPLRLQEENRTTTGRIQTLPRIPCHRGANLSPSAPPPPACMERCPEAAPPHASRTASGVQVFRACAAQGPQLEIARLRGRDTVSWRDVGQHARSHRITVL
jgi:hypothetical protein